MGDSCLSKAKIGKYAMLRHKKWRDREGLFIVQGRKAVEDTLPFFETEAIIEDPEAIRKISTLENLPDIMAVFKIPDGMRGKAEENDSRLKVKNGEFALLLDGIQDPGNLGTIIRTSHWFGVRRIYCSPDTVDVYNPKVVMSTMGSIAKVETIYCDLSRLLELNPDIPSYGLLLKGENIFECADPKPGFIIMGSEGHGISAPLIERISVPLTIPPASKDNHPDSLNVAVATAITLSQLLK